MALSTLLLAAYTWIALLFFDQTYREGAAGAWDGPRVLGLAMCIVWPFLLVYVIVLSYKARENT